MLFIVDNYDSFVYNIVQTIDYPVERIIVRRNDEIVIEEIADPSIQAIIISPGPMSPKEAGRSNEIIRTCKALKPILGICLGHQCIGAVFDCQITKAENPLHGQKSKILLEQSSLFHGFAAEIEAARYHSLVIDSKSFNEQELKIIARLEDGTIMGVEHQKYPVFGVQFHPESILSQAIGKRLFDNFLKIARMK